MHAIVISLLVLVAACGGSSPPAHKPDPSSACEQPCPSGQTCQQVDDCHDEPDSTQRCLGLAYACQPDPSVESYPCGEPCPSGQSCQQADTCEDQPDGTRRCMGLVYTCQPEPSP